MPILPFNQYGLLPAGIHPASIEEVSEKLGFSPRRQGLIETGLKPVLEQLAALGVKEVYLNGSFVTRKPSPGDIDGYVVTTLGSKVVKELVRHQHRWRTRYRVDLYPAFADLTGAGSPADWADFFGHTSDQPPKTKGIVKLMLGR